MPSFNGTLVFEPTPASAAGYTIELLYQRSVPVDGEPDINISELVVAAAAESGEFYAEFVPRLNGCAVEYGERGQGFQQCARHR